MKIQSYHHPRSAVWRCPSCTSAVPHNGHAKGSQTLRAGMASFTGSSRTPSFVTISPNDAVARSRYNRAPHASAGQLRIVPAGYPSPARGSSAIGTVLYTGHRRKGRAMSNRCCALSHAPRLGSPGHTQSSPSRRLSDGCAGGFVVGFYERHAWASSWGAIWTCAGCSYACAAVQHVSGARDAIVAAVPQRQYGCAKTVPLLAGVSR